SPGRERLVRACRQRFPVFVPASRGSLRVRDLTDAVSRSYTRSNVGGPSDTGTMNAMAAATDEQVSMLDSLVSSLQSVEQTLAGVLAARDGLLALAGKLALSMAEEGDGIDASDLTIRTVAAEVGAVLRLSDRTVQRRMGDA